MNLGCRGDPLIQRLRVKCGGLVLQSRNDRDEGVEAVAKEEVRGLIYEPRLTMQRWAHKVDECLLEAEAQAERVVKLLEAVVNVLQGRWANGIPDCQVRRPRRELVARSILFIV